MEDGKCFFIKAQKQTGAFKPFFMKNPLLENYFTKMIGVDEVDLSYH